MNDLQIDYFMAVATNLSFSKTAEELYVSQPAISRQISQLEKELGAKLFRRNNQKTELTEVGKLYFDLFSRYKVDYLNTKITADQILGKKRKIMRVGFLEGWDLFDVIPPVMDRYKESYPDSEVIINCCGVKDLSTGLLTNTLDFIVTMKNSITSYPEFETYDAGQTGKILMYSSRHPLADRDPDELTLRDFKHDLFIAPWEIVDKMIVEAISEYTRPYGFIPNLRFVKNHESTITCVRNNLGVTIADDWVWAKGAEDIRWMKFNASDTVSIARMRIKHDEYMITMSRILKEVISDYLAK